jgi:hypothetical protein
MLGNLVNAVIGFDTVRLAAGIFLIVLPVLYPPVGVETALVGVAQAMAGAVIVATCRNGRAVTIDTK